MKRLLITGGSGLIGSALIALLKKEHSITVLTRDILRCQRILGNHLHCISSLDQINDITAYWGVINLAGEPVTNKRWSQTQKKAICDSRWNLTTALIAKMMKSNSPPQVFISGSAIGIYGRQRDDLMIDESFTQMHDEFSHQLCSRWEQIALQATKRSRVVLLRTGIVLARDKGMLKKMALPFWLGMGGILGTGKQMMSWIHLDDVVAIILFLLQNHACHGAFNITAPYPVSNRVFTRHFAAQLHRPAWFTIPNSVQRLLFGEMADLFMYGQNVRPVKLLEAGFNFHYPTLVKALSEIYPS